MNAPLLLSIAPVKHLTAFFLLALLLAAPAHPQSRVLDDCESLDGWTSAVSEGAKLQLTLEQGKTGRALGMHFDLSGVYGYVIARKNFPLDLPGNYQFTFDLRADAPVNNFEFKVTDENDNVWWIKKLNITYPADWTRQRIKKRHLAFAWGPRRGAELRKVKSIEFVVSCGTGGKGTVFIDNFRFAPIDDQAAARAKAGVQASSSARGSAPRIDAAGTTVKGWKTTGAQPHQLSIDFGYSREVGGLVIDWDSLDYGAAYQVKLSEDRKEWTTVSRTTAGRGGRTYVYMPECEGRFLQLAIQRSSRNKGISLRELHIKGPDFSSSPNALFHAIAAESPHGYFPKYLLDKQSYWTVVGADGDTQEALMNEQGQVEVDKAQFSLEPFLYVDGKLVTWNDVTTTPALTNGYLPIPTVTWNYANKWELTIETLASSPAGKSLLAVHYSLRSLTSVGKVRLSIALRPFQVNPPWQFLNVEGGTARVDSIVMDGGIVRANGKSVISLARPTAFGATGFEGGEVIDYLSRGTLPANAAVHDPLGFASAAFQFDMEFREGETKELVFLVPFHAWDRRAAGSLPFSGPQFYFSMLRYKVLQDWGSTLSKFTLRVPQSVQPVVNTVLSNLAYILINRDGPGIQPGSRSYERSWIRDGSLTCTALLQTGFTTEVRDFIDWYAQGQFPNGKIPCVIDSRGPDAVPEHDSNGEFIYAVLQYFLYTKDTLWLRGKYDAVTRTVRYIQSLRQERKTDVYRNGTPEQRALYGLVPESISHEGYWDVPRHSYWDDFFILRGLKDATTIAAVLGQASDAAEFAAERDDFRKDLYASMVLAMANTKINYIPGCAELGDFDATSTTIGVIPGGELGNIPEPQLHNTFDKYFDYFAERKTKETGPNYTPYETRVIGTFVYLGQRKRAEEALAFFMHDRRPPEWNEWAEVVWRDPSTPKYIGDMPHTWVGSDFIRSVRSMFVYERERDTALVIGAGIPESWLADTTGIAVGGLPTYYGKLSYRMQHIHDSVVVTIGGGLQIPSGGIVVTSPIESPAGKITVNGTRVHSGNAQEAMVRELPATVHFEY
jgi:hypothetical protein